MKNPLIYQECTSHLTVFLVLVATVCLVWLYPAQASDVGANNEDDAMLRKLFALHSKLAGQGNLESTVKLGVLYELGEGVAKNRDKAIQLYQYAADHGNESAIELLRKIRSNKSATDRELSEITVPTPKAKITDVTDETRNRRELETRLQQEKASAEAARLELENLRRSQLKELEIQQRLKVEIEKVQQAQEQIARERARAEAKAEEGRREMELSRKKKAEEQQKQAELAKAEAAVVAKTTPENPPPAAPDGEQQNFSSNPCNTPVAKFMSTCD